MAGTKTLVGQWCGWSTTLSRSYLDDFLRQTGRRPMLVGASYETPIGTGSMQIAAVNQLLLAEWQAGSVVKVTWHARNPEDPTRGFKPPIYSWTSLFDGGTQTGQRWASYVDSVAAGLRTLRDAGVVVLLQPFTEMNTPGFWWGSRRDVDFHQLWRWAHDRLTRQHGLTNLIWVLNPLATDQWAANYYYPGDAYVDLVGFSMYPGSADWFTDVSRQAWVNARGLGKPLVFGEWGVNDTRSSYAPLPNSLRQWFADCCYVMAWDEQFAWSRHPGAAQVAQDARMVTR
jgi:mannan endo-1,4-beta-mannosidase